MWCHYCTLLTLTHLDYVTLKVLRHNRNNFGHMIKSIHKLHWWYIRLISCCHWNIVLLKHAWLKYASCVSQCGSTSQQLFKEGKSCLGVVPACVCAYVCVCVHLNVCLSLCTKLHVVSSWISPGSDLTRSRPARLLGHMSNHLAFVTFHLVCTLPLERWPRMTSRV